MHQANTVAGLCTKTLTDRQTDRWTTVSQYINIPTTTLGLKIQFTHLNSL